MSDAVLELARELVELDQRAIEIRNALRAALTSNDLDPDVVETPPFVVTSPPRASPKTKTRQGENSAARAREAEDRIVQYLRSSPGLRTSEIVRATQGSLTTTVARLKRLS